MNPLAFDKQLCFRLYAASRNMTRTYQPLLEKHDLTYPQYILLLILFEHNEMDFKELSHMIDLKTGTMTPIVQKLEKLGLVEKKKNPEDGRRFNVCLTDKGLEMEKELLHVPIDLAKAIGLEEERYLTLVEELDYLLSKLNASEVH